MNTHRLSSVLFSALALSPLARADKIPPQPVDGRIAWLYDYAEGQRLAQEKKQLMFVLFRCEQ